MGSAGLALCGSNTGGMVKTRPVHNLGRQLYPLVRAEVNVCSVKLQLRLGFLLKCVATVFYFFYFNGQ